MRAPTFRPRVLRGVEKVDTGSAVLGMPVDYPLILAPTGFTRIADPQGELAVARAADRAGLPYTLSTMSTRSIEEVRAVSNGRLWFQVYAWRDRTMVKEMIDRAAAARYEALVLTVDTAVLGRRERDVRRGFSLPPAIGPGTFVDGALHPAWTWNFLRGEPIRFANVAGLGAGSEVGDGASPVSLSDYINTQFDPALSWADVEWLRSVWQGPILLKGVQTVDDARLAATAGVAAVVLSNHGGRQLDGLRRRSTSWPRSSMRSAAAWRSSAMAGCAAAVTSSRRSRRGLRQSWPAGLTCTPSAQPAKEAWSGSCRGSRQTWSAP